MRITKNAFHARLFGLSSRNVEWYWCGWDSNKYYAAARTERLKESLHRMFAPAGFEDYVNSPAICRSMHYLREILLPDIDGDDSGIFPREFELRSYDVAYEHLAASAS